MKETYFEGQVIREQKIQSETMEYFKFIDCDFENCSFEDCKIINCTFENCKFYNCNIVSLSAQYSEIKNAEFKKCNLIGIHWGGLLPSGKYARALEKIENCYLKYNTFSDMNLKKFDFSGNIIQDSLFDECDLKESNFKSCRLEGRQIHNSDIRKADFRDSRGYIIDIPSNKLKQAKFSYPEVVSLLDSLDIEID